MSLRKLERHINNLPDVNQLSTISRDEHQRKLKEFTQGLDQFNVHKNSLRQELSGLAALYPSPWVRDQTLSWLGPYSQYADVRQAICWLIHDTDDFVIFRAMDLSGRYRLVDAMGELITIAGRPSDKLSNRTGKPVGVGQAVTINSLVDIMGTTDPVSLRQIEDKVKVPNVLGDLPSLQPENSGQARSSCAHHSHADMVSIPSGKVSIRVPDSIDLEHSVFEWGDVRDNEQTLSVNSFRMDIYPVTCASYDAFAASEDAQTHRFCHPEEPTDKIHVRNTKFDPRFGPDHPALGVDWFDAYAYAASVGKRLPTEWEWQRAAQGDDRRAYPWGDHFETDRCHWIEKVLDKPVTDLHDWRHELCRLKNDEETVLTVAVDALDCASPYGVVGMSGNAWEWTTSNIYSGQAMSPHVKGRDLYRASMDWQSFAVIRGGAWSSLPELMSVAFRGRDLITDRHFEIGFRCVCSE
jgi:formylglycine-generating enzyme required for sulfatase activity